MLRCTKEQSIPKRSPVAWRPACIPGGKPLEQPSAAAPAARLWSNRSPGRGAGIQMKGTVLFSGKQLWFCHLCFYQAKMTLFMHRHRRMMSAPLRE